MLNLYIYYLSNIDYYLYHKWQIHSQHSRLVMMRKTPKSTLSKLRINREEVFIHLCSSSGQEKSQKTTGIRKRKTHTNRYIRTRGCRRS
jgi:uncharacterized protein (DUF1919 family)